ncbi:MAG: hypothetical protein KAJ78_03465 [Acidobacteria bacterium]|nr:hypothetical protein [Acidobacteriota bacterium]
MSFKEPLLFVFVILISVSGIAGAADLEHRPGPSLVIRDKGVSEPVFLPPRVTGAKVATATFEVTYNGFSAEAQTAFQAAVDIWSQKITSPSVIRVEANWTPLEEDVLGSAGANRNWRGLPSDPNTWYPDALVDALAGYDVGEGEFDIVASFNSEYDRWYFGADGNTPITRTDLMSVVLHELCHGLGFSGSASVDEGLGSWGTDGFPVIFDRFTEDGAQTAIINTGVYPNPSEALASVLQSGSVFWGGSNAVAVNAGVRPRLFAPSEWEPGSSYSHLDESTYPASDPNSLMTPYIGRGSAIHDPGPITLCIFEDLGWATSETCGEPVEGCNALYDDGNSSDAAWFGGGLAGNPNFMMAVHFRLSDFGYQPGQVEITGFCAGNDLDLTGIGGPWANRVFVYPDDSGRPDDSVVLGQGDISTGDGTGLVTVTFGAPVLLNGDFWVINRGDPAHAGVDFNMEIDSAANVGRSFVSGTGIAGLALTDSGNYILRANLQPTGGGGGGGGDISYWVAAVARISGAGGSQWRTNLGAFNPSGSLVNALISYRRTGGGTFSKTVSIPAGGQVVLEDIVGFLGSSGSGSLEVSSDEDLLVGSRTYNQSATGTFGQYLDGHRPDDAFSAGDTVWLTMLEESAAFRTNIGFTNSGSTSALLQVTLFNSSGGQLTVFTLLVPAGSNVQENQPFLNRAGSSNIRAATASVEIMSGSGVIVYGSVIDNLTGDPTTIPAKIEP